ncbi:hypothetical protein VN12_19645 [Pirellula sp. SH-Sr6A]|uniref:hypothetical protein n=1 Tax=Pirellula sp. SH-Sr6A TaxID=1632865 RepID=UPI00078D7BDA|nr:hypothetical protein [Pirellula sp. SH-Sr6A]AMV30891.1 hypothetical protein VN12_02165 [Pirellula sp. SH-Sr6A]AMV31311.1 hypothetical protein VN12_04285 [Pirellula sp. SH-Sr6A]AMV34349.1 hypothetical protein VN12_19645 [Pirellula sp. SH-Sr6A]
MSCKKNAASNPPLYRGFAFVDSSGIDLNSIAKTEDEVKWNMLESSMGWRFGHPDRYCRDTEWERLLTYGKVVSVTVSVNE